MDRQWLWNFGEFEENLDQEQQCEFLVLQDILRQVQNNADKEEFLCGGKVRQIFYQILCRNSRFWQGRFQCGRKELDNSKQDLEIKGAE